MAPAKVECAKSKPIEEVNVCVCVCVRARGAYSSCMGTPNARRNLWPRPCICTCLHGWRCTRVSAEILRLHDSTKTMVRPRHSLAGFWNNELTMPSQQDHDMLTEHTRCKCSRFSHSSWRAVLLQLEAEQTGEHRLFCPSFVSYSFLTIHLNLRII